jgi:hypothetical protein
VPSATTLWFGQLGLKFAPFTVTSPVPLTVFNRSAGLASSEISRAGGVPVG